MFDGGGWHSVAGCVGRKDRAQPRLGLAANAGKMSPNIACASCSAVGCAHLSLTGMLNYNHLIPKH